jgi:16S rRNA (guanine966-N2)-methyltransferase
MPRIVAGTAGGRRLVAPTGSGTRPTSDRVREALFSTLGDLTGQRVLDGYAGSGAVGLEALSRGAAHALLVEHDRAALAALRANLAALGFVARVHAGDLERLVAAEPDEPYDLVFLDPPYADPVDSVVAALDAHGWLATGATLVVERSTRSAEPTWPRTWLARRRTYGETALWYVRAP